MDILEKALLAGTDVNLRAAASSQYCDATPLHYATRCHGLVTSAVIKFLVDHGADVDTGYFEYIGTPLEDAFQSQNLPAALTLVESGAELPRSSLHSGLSSVKNIGRLFSDEMTDELAKVQKRLITKLVELRIPINEQSDSEDRDTVLMHAVSDGELSSRLFPARSPLYPKHAITSLILLR